MSGLRLYWARNDGMRGHVFLDAVDVQLLRQEMVLQGIELPELEPGAMIPAAKVATALEHAGSNPLTLGDAKLWSDWLAFLDGAAENGGLIVS